MSGGRLCCSHCELPVPEAEAIREGPLAFCCEGCRSVYHILRAGGFDEFYSHRPGWRPGPPPDAAELEPSAFAGSVRQAGDTLTLDVQISGIRCASCVWLIENFLKRKVGVSEARINYATHRGRITWRSAGPSLKDILHAIRSIGYIALPYSAAARDSLIDRERRDLLLRFGTAAFFSMQLMLFTVALYAGYFKGMDPSLKSFFQYVTWALATPVVFYSGWPFFVNSIRSVRNRVLGMDVLVFAGSFSAYLYSIAMIFYGGEVYFDTSAMIITLILLGRYIEANAKGRASEAITAMLGLQPREVRLRGGGAAAIESVKAGDEIEVMPGGRVPLDGEIAEGEAEIDESMLTGESRPVSKRRGDEALAGTVCLNGHLTLKVTRTGDETVLSSIVRAVEEAQSRRAPIQAVSDRVVGWFVPAVLAIAAGTAAWWLHAGGGPSRALSASVAVLVIACPCALGLATPLAVLRGTWLASARGILVRGGDVLERAAHTDTLVFDKTGTLTRGSPVLTDVIETGNHTAEDVLRLAASLEAHSEHSFGRAVLAASRAVEPLPVEAFSVVAGRGVVGMANGWRALLGTKGLLEDEGVAIPEALVEQARKLALQGKTVSFLASGGRAAGLVAVADGIRDEARDIGKTADAIDLRMVTGDNAAAAAHIAAEAGLKAVHAGVTPEGKARLIRELKDHDRTVMMLGDGINDAPALSEAQVGVSMGRASDIALLSSDAVLMRNDPRAALELVDIARRTLRLIKQNLFWAFSYNLLAIPLAAAGLLHPIVSALCMAASSLLVVANSMRLRPRRTGAR